MNYFKLDSFLERELGEKNIKKKKKIVGEKRIQLNIAVHQLK